MPTGLPVNFAHTWESMLKGIDSSGPYYRVTYYVQDWSQSDNFANALRGYTTRVGSSTVRTPPHQHPLSTNLVCTDVTIEGVGNAVFNLNGFPYYDNGFLPHCEYRSIPYLPYATNDPGNQNQLDPTAPILWCSQEIDYEDETYVMSDKNKCTWDDTGLPSKIPVKVTLGVTTMHLTFHQLPYLPIPAIRTLRNSVNTVAVLGVDIGKLWFKGAKTTRELNTDGTMSQKLHMVFKERDIEWNKYLREDGTWHYLLTVSSAHILPERDLTPLLSI